MAQRNTTISIAKGIAIILMVAGHAECPGALMSFIYLFHMPLFFITAGYFFSRKYVDNPWNFCVKRIKGLYVPFVKWSLFFLLIHNLLFDVGILNEQYGNWSGGVTHPYSLHQFFQRLVHIMFSMGGYDEFLAGAFWFFRALLIASILFLLLYKMLDGRWKWLTDIRVVFVICAMTLAFAVFKISNGLKVATVIQGGIRETWGVLFFALGVLYRRFELHIRDHWALSLSYFGILLLGSYMGWAGMNLAPKTVDVLTLPLTGCVGFLLVHHLSSLIDRHDTWLKRVLVYCGEMTLYVYIFHIISFKLVSLLKIWYYDLDFAQIGCHMVIHEHHEDLFWILYTIAGVAIPLLWIYCYRKLYHRIKLS